MVANFSDKEFETVIYELFERDEACFDTLCEIAQRVLMPSIKRWCEADSALCKRGYEDDIMQEVLLRLIKTCITHFFCKNGSSSINRDKDGFSSWMFKVAINIKRDTANRERHRRMGEDELDADLATDDGELVDCFEAAVEHQMISNAISAVLDSDAHICKKLTWIAQCFYIVELDVTKIRSNELILADFSDSTLYEMRDRLLDISERIEWITVTAAQRQHIDELLSEKNEAGMICGQMHYNEFFMKKGGKATISDWVNRMNGVVRRVITNEALNS